MSRKFKPSDENFHTPINTYTILYASVIISAGFFPTTQHISYPCSLLKSTTSLSPTQGQVLAILSQISLKGILPINIQMYCIICHFQQEKRSFFSLGCVISANTLIFLLFKTNLKSTATLTVSTASPPTLFLPFLSSFFFFFLL